MGDEDEGHSYFLMTSLRLYALVKDHSKHVEDLEKKVIIFLVDFIRKSPFAK